MTLADYDTKMRPHLGMIEAGAEIVFRHASALPFKMPFQTHAQDELAQAERTLETALVAIKAARALYEAKPLETENV